MIENSPLQVCSGLFRFIDLIGNNVFVRRLPIL
jgi:hypothetical protein